MKYSQELVWKAIYVAIPTFQFARENGVKLNLPSSLKEAAFIFFIGDDMSLNTIYAMTIVKTALKELETDGMMTFGELNSLLDVITNNK